MLIIHGLFFGEWERAKSTQESIGAPVWSSMVYVMNPNKPDKIRDCAAQYNGVSLNYWILQVPGLTNNLVGVLTRFRQKPIALMIDVEGMFHQVRVNPKDCDVIRFPRWPLNDLNVDQAEYQQLVNLFRASSSPNRENTGLGRTTDAN